MADIFQEVNEDLSRDRYMRLWQSYGRFVIAFLVLIVAGVAGWVFWTEHQQSELEERGSRFNEALALMESGQVEAAALNLSALATDTNGGFSALVRLREADALLRAGDTSGAVAAYDIVAASRDATEELRDLAIILSAMHRLDLGTAGEIVNQLQDVVSKGGAWRFLAKEIQGLIALENGETENARALFQDLADDAAASETTRQRAREILLAIGA